MSFGCAVSINTQSKKPDLFSLSVDDQIRPRNISILLVGDTVFFADKEDENLRFTATLHTVDGHPAIHYDTFDEWPEHSVEEMFSINNCLSFTSVQNVIGSRCVAASKSGKTFSSLFKSQIEAFRKEMKNK